MSFNKGNVLDMNRRTISYKDFIAELKQAAAGNGITSVRFVCPHCKTPQSAKDLIEVGAGKDFDEVEKYLGFSCIGRFTNDRGCDWTLGGLFQLHELEIILEDGTVCPRFEIYKES